MTPPPGAYVSSSSLSFSLLCLTRMTYSLPEMKHLRLLLALTLGSSAYPVKPAADEVAAVMDDLRSCAVGLSAGLPADKKSQDLAEEIRANAPALAEGLRGKAGIPAEYIARLNDLVGICRPMLMSFAPGSPFAATKDNVATIESFARDITLKASDVASNRTGRIVPIEVRTFKAGQLDSGWTVYYQWAPAAPGKDVVLAAPTPAATGAVVPGLYSFRAEKTVNGRKVTSQVKLMPIGGYLKVQVAITVP